MVLLLHSGMKGRWAGSLYSVGDRQGARAGGCSEHLDWRQPGGRALSHGRDTAAGPAFGSALTLPASEASTALLAHPLHSLIMNTMGKLQGQRVHMCLACVSDMCSSLSAAAECCASGALAGAERSAMLRCGRLPRRGRKAWCCWLMRSGRAARRSATLGLGHGGGAPRPSWARSWRRTACGNSASLATMSGAARASSNSLFCALPARPVTA